MRSYHLPELPVGGIFSVICLYRMFSHSGPIYSYFNQNLKGLSSEN
jgi:hypothetical protein